MGACLTRHQCRVHQHECFETRSQGRSSTHRWWDMGRPSWVLHRACTSITSYLLLTFCSHSYRLIYNCICMLVSFSVVCARSWLFSLVSQLYTLGHAFSTCSTFELRVTWFKHDFTLPTDSLPPPTHILRVISSCREIWRFEPVLKLRLLPPRHCSMSTDAWSGGNVV